MTEVKEENISIDLGILRVTNQGFIINEAVDVTTQQITLGYSLDIEFSEHEDWVEFRLTSKYRVLDSEEDFLMSKALTRFLLRDIQRFLNRSTGKLTVPDNVMVTMFSICYSHARAIQAINTSGTKFSNLYLPMINPKELLSQILWQA